MPVVRPEPTEERTKKLRLVSRIVLIATAVVWAVYDVIPSINQGRGDTLSENMRDWSRSAWSLPLIWGALTSHFFINIGQPENYHQFFYAIAIIGLIATVCNAIVYYATGWTAPVTYRAICLVVGMALGVALWAQNP